MTIEIDLSVWCEEHATPFQAHARLMTGTVRMVHWLLNDEEFMRACGWDPEAGQEADADRIPEELEARKPLCCHLGEEVMQGIREEVLKQ